MRSLPRSLDEGDLIAALTAWRLHPKALDYAAVGGGSYHWVARERDGARYFITVDDLSVKPWLGPDRDSAFVGLRASMDSALLLRKAGLEFVVAPLAATGGDTVRRINQQYSLAVFPFVDGHAGGWDSELTHEECAQLVGVLAALHQATPAVIARAPRRTLELPGRDALEAALGELDRPWVGGPFAEPARAWLAANAAAVQRLLTSFDRLVVRVRSSGRDPVITHGEPHPGNQIRTADGLFIVDWDTVALTLPERDLWFLDARCGDSIARYVEATGRPVDDTALMLYRLLWDLADLAAFIGLLRSEHERTPDTEKAWTTITQRINFDERPELDQPGT